MSTSRRVKRRVYFDGERAFISLGKAAAVVDTDDVGRVSRSSWRLAAGGYAMAGVKGRAEYMHRVLADATAGVHVDHIDCDRLNNRRSNLRLCTRAENMRNQPLRARGYKGAYQQANGRYSSKIVVNKRQVYLGTFATAEQAARAYDQAARKHFGVFARCNFP